MAYCTQQDLEERLGRDVLVELTDIEKTGEVDATRVSRACDDATAEIDSYVQARYPVPFEPVPPVVRRAAVTIAVALLFTSRGYDRGSSDEAFVDAYRATVAWLKEVARGHATLGVPQPAKDLGARVTAAPRVFTREKMEGF